MEHASLTRPNNCLFNQLFWGASLSRERGKNAKRLPAAKEQQKTGKECERNRQIRGYKLINILMVLFAQGRTFFFPTLRFTLFLTARDSVPSLVGLGTSLLHLKSYEATHLIHQGEEVSFHFVSFHLLTWR